MTGGVEIFAEIDKDDFITETCWVAYLQTIGK
jgi:hypothetical protein